MRLPTSLQRCMGLDRACLWMESMWEKKVEEGDCWEERRPAQVGQKSRARLGWCWCIFKSILDIMIEFEVRAQWTRRGGIFSARRLRWLPHVA